MRARSNLARRIAAAAGVALVAVLASATMALAKEGGIVTLAAPIPLDAEPGSTITVAFTATILTEDGPRPVQGSPMVLRLTGPEGATTEAMATEVGRPGSYAVEIVVPAGGVDRADFGLRGTMTSEDGSSMVEDIPFDVDGVLFALHPDTALTTPAAPAPNAPPPPDLRAALLVLVVGVVGLVAAGLLVMGRRRTLGSA